LTEFRLRLANAAIRNKIRKQKLRVL